MTVSTNSTRILVAPITSTPPSFESEQFEGSSALRETFLHVTGVGEVTENRLKNAGVVRWEDVFRIFGKPQSLPGLKPLLKRSGNKSLHERVAQEISYSQLAVRDGDVEYFGDRLPPKEWWRLYDEFREGALFLDIETTGLSKRYHQLTIVGYYSLSDGFQVYVQGEDPTELQEALSKASLIVTFNGASFDLPFLHAKLPALQFPQVHLDLRRVLYRLGLSGGLKAIERELNIGRPDGGAAGGREAVALWYRHLRGDSAAFERLVEYNFDDTVGLKTLADYAVATFKGDPLSAEVISTSVVERPNLSQMVDKGRSVASSLPRWTVEHLWTTQSAKKREYKIIGIDLTGSESRPSGWAALHGVSASTMRLKTDDEIIAATLDEQPDIVSIDSPLSLPPGTLLGPDGQVKSHVRIHRDSELELKRRGISVYWCLLPSMVQLTLRGIRLASRFRQHGLKVIESYPGGAQDMLAMPRKGTGVEELAEGLLGFGIKGEFEKIPISHDELDAITSAIVGMCYLAGKYEALGPSDENDLIMPALT